MGEYQPELGQAMFGCPSSEYEVPRFAVALFDAIVVQVERVFWNSHQREWDHYESPAIPAMEWRPYYWGDDEAEAAKPNFTFDGVEIRWYKHPGRGMSCNVEWEPHQWADWFNRCLEHIIAREKD